MFKIVAAPVVIEVIDLLTGDTHREELELQQPGETDPFIPTSNTNYTNKSTDTTTIKSQCREYCCKTDSNSCWRTVGLKIGGVILLMLFAKLMHYLSTRN